MVVGEEDAYLITYLFTYTAHVMSSCDAFDFGSQEETPPGG